MLHFLENNSTDIGIVDTIHIYTGVTFLATGSKMSSRYLSLCKDGILMLRIIFTPFFNHLINQLHLAR